MLVLGHRGAVIPDASFSQNSMPAFEYALAEADGFETDACVSQDGEVFLVHDIDDGQGFSTHLNPASAARVGKLHVDQLTQSTLKTLRLEKGEPIPTLRQAVEIVGQHPDKTLNIELKGHGATRPVLKVLKDCIFHKLIEPEALVISSFDHAALKIVRDEMPNLKIGALFVVGKEEGERIFPSYADNQSTYVKMKESALRAKSLSDIEPDILVMPEKLLNKQTVTMIEAIVPGALLSGWTVSESDVVDQVDLLMRLKRIPQQRMASMIVDDPKLFVAALRKNT